MSTMKFATIFTNLSVVHLAKDIGMIPMEVSAIDGFERSEVYCWAPRGEPEWQAPSDYLTVSRIKAPCKFLYYIKLIYKIKTSHVTYVNLYHLSLETFFLALAFKLLRLKVYLKLDMGDIWLEKFLEAVRKSPWRWKAKRAIISMIDCSSVESESVHGKLSGIWPNRKLLVIPNAVSKLAIPAGTVRKEYKEREKIVLVVGRVGAPEKNHEIILDALRSLNAMNGWKVIFAGPCEFGFREKAMQLLSERDELCIEFTGHLERPDLFKLYGRSRIFLMSSKWEGFSLAMMEAASMGLVIVSTPVGGYSAITSDGKYGICFSGRSSSELCGILTSLFDDDTDYASTYTERVSYIDTKFDLKKDVENLIKVLSDGQ